LLQAYDFVETHYGLAIDSAWFWHEYVSFVKKSDTNNPWEKTKELTQARKIYQRVRLDPARNDRRRAFVSVGRGAFVSCLQRTWFLHLLDPPPLPW
jgi:hypothetical protein